MEQDIPHFHGWLNVPGVYKTKTELRRNGLKPVSEEQYDATLKARMGGKWKDFVLYKVDNCVPIQKLKVKQVDLIDNNIAEALYIINKSAKKSRDTKVEKYTSKEFLVVSRSKTRQMKLYDLKDKVINKLISENKIKIVGYHEQDSEQDINYLLFYEFNGYTFHVPCNKNDTLNLNYLGKIGVIPAQSKKTILKFNEAVQLLERYLKN